MKICPNCKTIYDDDNFETCTNCNNAKLEFYYPPTKASKIFKNLAVAVIICGIIVGVILGYTTPDLATVVTGDDSAFNVMAMFRFWGYTVVSFVACLALSTHFRNQEEIISKLEDLQK